jgi:hypothetical protein
VWRRVGTVVLLGVVVVTTGACGGTSGPVGVQGPVGPSQVALAVVLPSTVSAPVQKAAPQVYRRLGNGVLLPSARLTTGSTLPGAKVPGICALHYTMGIRQPRFNAKVDTLIAYGVPLAKRTSYQLDHLIPVSLGGDNRPQNLWPQPLGPKAADLKDRVELRLHSLVCSGHLTLVKAQLLIRTNWWRAYQHYGAAPKPQILKVSTDGAVNGWTCAHEGTIGYTVPKHVPLRCTLSSSGKLQWAKQG